MAADIARLGPKIEAGLVAELVGVESKKRAETFALAYSVIQKLNSERNKIKPDVPAVKKEDGSVLTEAGWTDKNLKSRKELGERVQSLTKAFQEVSDLQLADEPDAQRLTESYAKLRQAADKASKGVSNASAEPDGE